MTLWTKSGGQTRSPAGIADPIYREQLAARIPGSIPKDGPQPGDRVDEFFAHSGHVLSSFVTFCFDVPAIGRPSTLLRPGSSIVDPSQIL
jgi:hypothetical protein